MKELSCEKSSRHSLLNGLRTATAVRRPGESSQNHLDALFRLDYNKHMIVKESSQILPLPRRVVVVLDGRYLQYAFREAAVAPGLIDRGVLKLIESEIEPLVDPILNEFPCAHYPLIRVHLVMPVCSESRSQERLEVIRDLHRISQHGVSVWPVPCRLEPNPDGEAEYCNFYLGDWAVEQVQRICEFEKPDIFVIVSELIGLSEECHKLKEENIATIAVELDGDCPNLRSDDPPPGALWAICDAWTMIEDDSLTK